MTAAEMKTRAWLILNDDVSTPVKLSAANALLYINQAIQDLAPILRKRKSSTLSFTAGVASWPTDLAEVIRIEDDGTKLDEIFDLDDAVAATATTSQWIWLSAAQVQIYGATPTGTVTLYYYGTSTALSQDGDIPSDIPARMHHYIPEIYVPAMYHLSKGDANSYAAFMEIWENKVKDEISSAVAWNRYNSEDGHTQVEEWW